MECYEHAICPVCHKNNPELAGQTLDCYTMIGIEPDGTLYTRFECSCEDCRFSYSGDFTRQIPLE